jgi:hypothetical protein
MRPRWIWLGAAFVASSANAQTLIALPSQDYTTARANELLDFRYSFPIIVSLHPELLAQIQADRSDSYDDALATARADYASSSDRQFPQHQFWRDWTATGQTALFVGLESRTEFFTGGAHPNRKTSWLLWDWERKATVDPAKLFQRGADLWASLKDTYCDRLAQERMRRAGAPLIACPRPDELTIEFLDTDLNAAFDTVRLIADPYVAGSYVEGSYAVSLPVTDKLITGIMPEFRDSFEVPLP